MVELGGEDSLGEMLDAYRDNLNTIAAVQRVFGVEQPTFEKGYREYLDRVVAGIKQPAAAEEAEQKPLAELEKAFRANPESATARGEYAAGLWEAGQFKQARKFANSALKKNPAQPRAAIVLAQLEIKGANPAQAIEYLKNALDEQHPHPGVVKLLGQFQLQAENYAEAARVYELIHKDDAQNVAWIKALAVAYLKLGDTEKLKPLLKQFVELEFDEVAPRKKLAAIYIAEKNYTEALRYAKTALYIDVLDVEVHRLLGEAYAGQKQFDRAIEEFQIALELKPGDADLTFALAETQHQAGDNPAAAKTLRELLLKHPKHKAAGELLKQL
jgi:tetratricopeptide (TPR) repeat protein